MKSYSLQSTTRILALIIVAGTLIGTQIPSWKPVATEFFIYEVCLLLIFILSSINWRRYF